MDTSEKTAPSPLFTRARGSAKTIVWNFTDIQRCSYAEGVELQKQYVKKVKEDSSKAYLLFLEHPPTLTLGYRMDETSAEKEISYFKNKNYDIVRSERGGLLTLHNPGQLLCYPIVNLRRLKIGPFEWIEYNLKLIKESLEALQVPAFYRTDTVGVFTEKGKIASMGFRIREGISTHGFAINVKNDLQDFYAFNPCGLCQVGADSVASYDASTSLEDLYQKITLYRN